MSYLDRFPSTGLQGVHKLGQFWWHGTAYEILLLTASHVGGESFLRELSVTLLSKLQQVTFFCINNHIQTPTEIIIDLIIFLLLVFSIRDKLNCGKASGERIENFSELHSAFHRKLSKFLVFFDNNCLNINFPRLQSESTISLHFKVPFDRSSASHSSSSQNLPNL